MQEGEDMMNYAPIIWEVFQQYDACKSQQTEAPAGIMVAAEPGAKFEVDRVEDKIDRLALICRAMFELLQESTGITEQMLAKRIAEVDIRDGKADGHMTPAPRQCPSCKSMISPRFNRCLFCGYKDKSSDPFNTVK
jgi:hypothetical protein